MSRILKYIDEHRTWWFICVVPVVALISGGYAYCYKSFYDDNPSTFCYLGTPLTRVQEPTSAGHQDQLRPPLDSSRNQDTAISKCPPNAKVVDLRLRDFLYFSVGVITTGPLGDITPNCTIVRLVITTEYFAGILLLVVTMASLATLRDSKP